MSVVIDRNALWHKEDLIRDVGASRWIPIGAYSRGAVLIGGSGDYNLTFAVRTLYNELAGEFAHAVFTDGAGNVVGITVSGGDVVELPSGLFVFHAFRVNFEPTAGTGNPVGIVLKS